MSYDENGIPVWKSMLSPESMTDRALVLAPPNKVIPILFVPGIMGSNIKVVDTGKTNGQSIAWRPDGAGLSDLRRSASERQTLLDPTNTEVDTAVTFKKKTVVIPLSGMSLDATEKRGWGSVMWGSYGEILHYLELNANSACFWEPALKKVVSSAVWQPLIEKGLITNGAAYKLQQPELEHLSQFWFPVHAVGYNWLQSNEVSGIYLAKKISETITFYQKQFKSKDACQKVILLTHSMGGLVARAAVHPEMGKAKESVLGIVHGVMPAIGAASTYKRMRSGFGPQSIFTKEGQTNGVLGENGKEVTAVLGHSPGGLQLLPNKEYLPNGWLKVEGLTSKPYVIATSGNPYSSIYIEKDKWWRLVNSSWLDPASKFASGRKADAWDSYAAALTSAEKFHDSLAGQYHANSYVFYGLDKEKKYLAYGDVFWKSNGRGPVERFEKKGTPTTSNESLLQNGLTPTNWDDSVGGTATDFGNKFITLKLADPRDPGDGTVPAISGAAKSTSGNIKLECGIANIDHQGAYAPANTEAIKFVLYSICKIAQELKV